MKSVTNVTVRFLRKIGAYGNRKRGIRAQARRERGKLSASCSVLFADGLHDDCSLSGVDIGFHEN